MARGDARAFMLRYDISLSSLFFSIDTLLLTLLRLTRRCYAAFISCCYLFFMLPLLCHSRQPDADIIAYAVMMPLI